MIPFYCRRDEGDTLAYNFEAADSLCEEAKAFAQEQMGYMRDCLIYVDDLDAIHSKLLRARGRIAAVFAESDQRRGADLNRSLLQRRVELLQTLSNLDFMVFMEVTIIETEAFSRDTSQAYWRWMTYVEPPADGSIYIRKLLAEFEGICLHLKKYAEPELKRLKDEGYGMIEEDRGSLQLLDEIRTLEDIIRDLCVKRLESGDACKVQYARTVLETVL